MRLHSTILASLLLALAISSDGMCESSDNSASPEAVLQEFCRLDAMGMRLTGDTSDVFKGLVDWHDAGGEELTAISDYKIGKAIIHGDEAIVPVDYGLIGSTDFITFSNPEPTWKNPYPYKLRKVNGQWKIYYPVSAPHVHWESAIRHIRKIQASEPARGEVLEGIVNAILSKRQ